jgi:hypothetical protein
MICLSTDTWNRKWKLAVPASGKDARTSPNVTRPGVAQLILNALGCAADSPRSP